MERASRPIPEIEFGAAASRQLERLPRSAFTQLRDELAELFTDADALPLLAVDSQTEVTADLVGMRVRCSYDRERNTLTVIGVEPPAPAAKELGMNGRLFVPRGVRGMLALLPVARRMELETHLENLVLLAATGGEALASRFPLVDGCFVSEPWPGVRLHFSVDPMTSALHLHRVIAPAELRKRT